MRPAHESQGARGTAHGGQAKEVGYRNEGRGTLAWGGDGEGPGKHSTCRSQNSVRVAKALPLTLHLRGAPGTAGLGFAPSSQVQASGPVQPAIGCR